MGCSNVPPTAIQPMHREIGLFRENTNCINIDFQFFRSTNAEKTFENLSKITRMSKLQMATEILIELYRAITLLNRHDHHIPSQ